MFANRCKQQALYSSSYRFYIYTGLNSALEEGARYSTGVCYRVLYAIHYLVNLALSSEASGCGYCQGQDTELDQSLVRYTTTVDMFLWSVIIPLSADVQSFLKHSSFSQEERLERL